MNFSANTLAPVTIKRMCVCFFHIIPYNYAILFDNLSFQGIISVNIKVKHMKTERELWQLF